MTSADGTVIAVDRSGAGPAVVLVQGALNERADPVMAGLAAGLSRWFTVFSYDRRGRGGSGDTRPYAVEREIEDLAAVIAEAGGQAAVFGGSSGAGLALRAAVRNPAITRLALWEPPYHVDGSAPPLPGDFAEQLDRLVEAGRQADAVELFLVRAVQASPQDVAGMRGHASWPAMEAERYTGCSRASRTRWRPRPSSPSCLSSSSHTDRARPPRRAPQPAAAPGPPALARPQPAAVPGRLPRRPSARGRAVGRKNARSSSA